MTNYCPGCNHPVLLRAPDGTCGLTECHDYVVAKAKGEDVEPPYVIRRREEDMQRIAELRTRYPEFFV